MSPDRRIALNALAIYGRSLCVIAVGLFCGRWTLLSLGVVDYGILGLIGGLVAFVTFLNGVLSGAVSRYYALSVGKGDIRECRRWFSTAVSLHTAVPVALMAVGYPLGVHAIGHWLTIPADRLADAVWVWRFTCLGAFATMVNVPFNAMFVAKQRFGEISLYGVLIALANACVLYYMVTHPGAWLVKFAAWICLSNVLPALVIMARAFLGFDECRILKAHILNFMDIRELGCFIGWMVLGGFGLLLRSSGMAVLINKLFGPARNAAFTVATTVSDQSTSLTASMLSAFIPAITTAYGAGDRQRVESLSNSTCKFCGLALLPFVVPLALEMDEVLAIWLATPPKGASSLCVWILVSVAIDKATAGLWPVLEASGRVAVWQMLGCAIKVMALALAGGFGYGRLGLNGVGIALVMAAALDGILHVVLTWRYFGFSPLRFVKNILLPLVAVAVAAIVAGALPRFQLSASFARVVCTTLAANLVLLPLAWLVVLNRSEREQVRRWLPW